MTPLPKQGALATVAYTHLLRARRLAAAVAALGPGYGYEGRVLVRALMESYFNYAWIRLEDSEVRAERYLQFHVLEKLTVMADYPSELRGPGYELKMAQLRRDRLTLRHLFQYKDRTGKFCWAKSWASVGSFDGRLAQVQAAETPGCAPADRFMYMLYRWFSGVAHGSPQSVAELLRASPGGLEPKSDGELRTLTSMQGAAITLFSTAVLAVRDLGLPSHAIDRVDQRWASFKSDLLNDSAGPAA